MSSTLKWLRLTADPSRLRILLLLHREELSVAELQEILSLGQSTISTHLAQLKQAGLLDDRRTGKHILYRLKAQSGSAATVLEQLLDVLRQGAAEVPGAEHDIEALQLVLGKRQDRIRAYFDELAGRFGREYVPGRSWRGLAEALLQLLPALRIADLGAGEGTFSQLLATRAEHVIAVDNSRKMVEYGAELARRHGVANLEYRLGDMEQVPIEDQSVDVAFFSQALHHAPHPGRAVQEAWRILRPGGRIVIRELLKHHHEEARDVYADLWLGFSEVELQSFLREAEFSEIRTLVVHREQEPPFFETMLGTGTRCA
jgi:ubiquinone/menaquinone biosynthesis C-methylase UbiE/DNA-binding MarR family transcriptional regulator